MDKSFWSDLITLAKAGYKPSDVKELLALGKEDPADPHQKDDKPKDEDKDNGSDPKDEDPKEKKSVFQTLAES